MNQFAAAALVNRQADFIVNEVEDVHQEFASDLQVVIATKPVIGWAPYSHLVEAQDTYGEIRSYLVAVDDSDDNYFAHRGACQVCGEMPEIGDRYCAECGSEASQ